MPIAAGPISQFAFGSSQPKIENRKCPKNVLQLQRNKCEAIAMGKIELYGQSASPSGRHPARPVSIAKSVGWATGLKQSHQSPKVFAGQALAVICSIQMCPGVYLSA